ncbi:MAG: hypothetical protein Kow0029_11570 [Candidatus Rifleibacteriota bacterium]
MKKSFLTVAIACSFLFANQVSAEAKGLEGRLSLGYSESSGNTEEEKVNFNFNLKNKKNEKLNLLYKGLINYGKSGGNINSDKKQFGVIGEFIKDSKNSFYLESGILKDQFAGYETKLNFGLGHFKTIMADNKRNLKAALGLEITKEDYTDSTSKTRQWLKLGLTGDRMVGENVKLLSSVDFGAPRKKIRNRYEIDFMLGILFTVNSQIDLETKYLANYRKSPLVAGKEKTDSTFLTNLIYKM